MNIKKQFCNSKIKLEPNSSDELIKVLKRNLLSKKNKFTNDQSIKGFD